MKNSVAPTRRELVMRDSDFIVSKTDTSGCITYANQTFLEFSGYREREILGVQHNIIRHPDMPRGVFKLLWDTLKTGGECFAYVKNLAKDGSYYWVFANVTPDHDGTGQTVGYFSVRRKPGAAALDIVSSLYQQMLQVEHKAGPRDATSASLAWLNGQLGTRNLSYEEFILSL